ncbi:hypothetical protein ACQKMI_01270 [Lysinibacillus sp. NPDC097214]|uniref:hypothetical protein n=1 Tax=Lysinibacillus sp. NPDC097214 TaxID=3390584 RepID=UPI003D00031D
MYFVRKRSANVATAHVFVCAKAKRQQHSFICAKAKRQQHSFICAKAKRQQQQQHEGRHDVGISIIAQINYHRT